ncbi:MerR family transcriptional regulator [Polymorphobacter multimanifer]|uniref:DNA-binding transcriptional MerR regulator n=1 Tax=Polymorphobacter multimanifer TaxID=1070431 RepID=A0A841L6J6_9SPHN|nr:MerR family transcriptional regulator [Polymorphobacter multimanifer]MBB6228237.1 DNA-binding transcriptional MerR regulator [Polymorphobacter multimanifer]
MRELEAASGIGRETIRFYIREGLLPEPARTSRNSATYSDVHVTRLHTIKRLQEERFLPLAVIRTLLDADDSASWLAHTRFPMLDALIAPLLSPPGGRRSLAEIMRSQGLDPALADAHVATGMIKPDAAGTVSAGDAAILAILKQMWELGLTRDQGFLPKDMRIFVDLVDWLVRQEMKLFFGNMADRIGEAQAVQLVTKTVPLLNDLLAHLHNRAVLQQLGDRRTIANDNPAAAAARRQPECDQS